MEVAGKTDDDHLSRPELVSPDSKSRYGRVRKPKITRDFFNIDDVVIDESVPDAAKKSLSPSPTKKAKSLKSPELPLVTSVEKPPVIKVARKKSLTIGLVPRFEETKVKGGFEESINLCPSDLVLPIEKPQSRVLVEKLVHYDPEEAIFAQPLSPPGIYDIKDEFTKLDDLGMKVANNFKANLQRGLDDTIKDRKFFKSALDTKVEVSNVVDVTKVLKLISKPVIAEFFDKNPGKSHLKTYSNKRKHLSGKAVVETFGLPDQPIVPLDSPVTKPITNKKLDVDVSLNVDVNLANPWTLDDFQQPPPPPGPAPSANVNGKSQFKSFNGVSEADKLRLSPLANLSGNVEDTCDFLDMKRSSQDGKKEKVKTKNGKAKAEILKLETIKASDSENSSRVNKGAKRNNVVYKVTKVKTIKPISVNLTSRSKDTTSQRPPEKLKCRVVERKVIASPRRTASSSKNLKKNELTGDSGERAVSKLDENGSRKASLRSSKGAQVKIESPKLSKTSKKRNANKEADVKPQELAEVIDENKNSSRVVVVVKQIGGDSSTTPEHSISERDKSESSGERTETREGNGKKRRRPRTSSDFLIRSAKSNIIESSQDGGGKDFRISRSRTRNLRKVDDCSNLTKHETAKRKAARSRKSDDFTSTHPLEREPPNIQGDYGSEGEKCSDSSKYLADSERQDSELSVETSNEDGDSGKIPSKTSDEPSSIQANESGVAEIVEGGQLEMPTLEHFSSVEVITLVEHGKTSQNGVSEIVDKSLDQSETSEVAAKEDSKLVAKITRSSFKNPVCSSTPHKSNSTTKKERTSEGVDTKTVQLDKCVIGAEAADEDSIRTAKKSGNFRDRGSRSLGQIGTIAASEQIEEANGENVSKIASSTQLVEPETSQGSEESSKNGGEITARRPRNFSTTPKKSFSPARNQEKVKRTSAVKGRILRSSSRTPDRSSSFNQSAATPERDDAIVRSGEDLLKKATMRSANTSELSLSAEPEESFSKTSESEIRENGEVVAEGDAEEKKFFSESPVIFAREEMKTNNESEVIKSGNSAISEDLSPSSLRSPPLKKVKNNYVETTPSCSKLPDGPSTTKSSTERMADNRSKIRTTSVDDVPLLMRLNQLTKSISEDGPEILSKSLCDSSMPLTLDALALRDQKLCKSQVRIVLNPLAIMKQFPEHFPQASASSKETSLTSPRNSIESSHKETSSTGSRNSIEASPKETSPTNPKNSVESLQDYQEYWPKRLRSSTGGLTDFPLIDWTVRRKKRNLASKEKKGRKRRRKSRSPRKAEVGIVKNEVIEYEVGNLAWARIGTHPFWPCLITEEPASGHFRKNKAKWIHPWYHVQFFGDNGRRAWVSAAHIMPYCGEDDLERMYKEAMAEKKFSAQWINEAYTVKSKKLVKWRRGVDEAQSLKPKTVEERLHYFLEFFTRKRIERARQELEIKQEILEEPQLPEPPHTKRIKIGSLERSGKRPRKLSGDEDVKHKRFKSDENEDEPAKSPEIKEEIVEESEAGEEVTPKLRSKRHVVQNEFSDTDSKFSDNSSVPASLESQAALYKRNNIFRGVPKEKVCQLCGVPGDIIKCRGPCNGFYHYNCAIINEKPALAPQIADVEVEDKKPIVSSNKVEIISVISRKPNPLPSLSSSPNFKGMSLAEKIDYRMKEIMKNFDYQSIYGDSADSSSSEEFVVEDETFEQSQDNNSNKLRNDSNLTLTVTERPSRKEFPIIKHVTADNVNYICLSNDRSPVKPKVVAKEETVVKLESREFKCDNCAVATIPRCFVCNEYQSKIGSEFRQKCSLHQCGRYYHPECLKIWPQTQWSLINSTKDVRSDARYATFVCPRHVCHTCVSDDPRAAGNSRCSSDKVVKCLHCPATYHCSSYCVPAGTEILTSSQIVCPRHHERKSNRTNRRSLQTVNANWCFICSKGGNLICCETCPTSVHVECLPGDLDEDDTFFCEDCQSGRLPLYDEIVWVKLGLFRWWPAVILFPNEVPDNVRQLTHNKGEFVVKFFGTYDHYWVGRGRTFLFQEGDRGHSNHIRKKVDSDFAKAIEEAAAAHRLKKQFKVTKVAEKNSGLKPPPYIRIKVNRPVGNVRQFDGNISNTTSCDCYPNQPHPCGPDSDCLNRLLLTECNPEVCPAGDRCNNQCFEKREYPPLVPHRTQVRGWGLKTLAPIRKGQFVIEYVGEMIDEQEYQRRVKKMHEQKEENYYFLTIDNQRMLDAGPKGNVARFMNHSCQPNCETQKWTVNGDTRVGLFAKCDIPTDAELTFNYNLECIGKEKKICRCGAPNCSGFIGGKVKAEEAPKKSKRLSKSRKKKSPPPATNIIKDNPCFVCGKIGEVGACNNKICTKFYHLECIGLETWPEGAKWVCPWHNCNLCSKRTIRCCVRCTNSYCPSHSELNMRYDKLLGFVCTEHDPIKECGDENGPKAEVEDVIEEGLVTSPTCEDSKSSDCQTCEAGFTALDNLVTSTPLKKVTTDSVSQKPAKKGRKNDTEAKNTAKLFSTPANNDISAPVRNLRTTRQSSEAVVLVESVKAASVTKTVGLGRGYLL